MRKADRKRLLEMAQRRAAPGSGSVHAMVREEQADYGWTEDVPDLGDVRYAIVGGLATARYMPPRMTLDTDLLILGEDLERVEACLAAGGCTRVGPLTIGGSSWKLPKGRALDVIALAGRWVGEALDAVVWDGSRRPFASLPYLVLMKLESGRLQDLADISRMLGCADAASADEVRRVIGQYRPQDMDDLESMHRLGKLEHES
ncbi:MAG: hypothetical protein HN341_10945 [Verrucomicrobia bacterium]|jgi:hypothetical protein|nr:hypothetical protein [Verrucomicrobiota bacterium]